MSEVFANVLDYLETARSIKKDGYFKQNLLYHFKVFLEKKKRKKGLL